MSNAWCANLGKVRVRYITFPGHEDTVHVVVIGISIRLRVNP